MGGEKQRFQPLALFFLGSPPHGRGKVRLLVFCSLGTGITPAWAGKSDIIVNRYLGSEDHPRMGGEKATGLVDSSPQNRITPA